MKKQTVCILAALSMLYCMTIDATSQFRSPLSLEYDQGPIHYPLQRAREAWWAGLMGFDSCDEVVCGLDFDVWAGGYYRCADKGFCDSCDDSCDNSCDDPCDDNGKVTRKTTSLVPLFFRINDCKEFFRGEEFFPGGMLSCEGDNFFAPPFGEPFLRFARITPNFRYSEKGAVFGLNARYRIPCAPCWSVGARVSIPFKVVEVINGAGKLEEGLEDVVGERLLDAKADGNPTKWDFAYRLDFLSCLVRPALPVSLSMPIVEYSPEDGQVTRIAGTPVGATDKNAVPIYLVKSASGAVPPRVPFPNHPGEPNDNPTWAKQAVQVSGQLPPDGSGVDGSSCHFGNQTVNYRDNLGNDREAQGTLFVVPHLADNGLGFALNTTKDIRSAIKQIIDSLFLSGDQSAVEFFRNQGIDLAKDERIVGQGDLRFELYGGYSNWQRCYFVNGLLGFVAPTGKRLKDANRVLAQTTGNNGHFEVKVGVEGGWQPLVWFALDAELAFNHAFKRTEKKAAPFKGATARNLGPTIDADVSWSYFVGHLDFTFFNPCNSDLGLVFGYELFAKGKDSVTLCETTAKTFFDVTAELDPEILEKRTNAQTHKLRGEIFYRNFYFEIFAGASQVLAGKNAMKETEAHIGFMVLF